jgi:two-component system OmpR family response regulator
MLLGVLVVEDDLKVRSLVSDSLSIAGFKVFEATEGSAAVKLLRAEDVSLVVLDVNLPGKDGFTLVDTFRKIKPDILILFLTAMVDRDSVNKGFELGGDDYLRKPFEIKELIYRVQSLLKRSKSWSTGELESVISVSNLRIDKDNRKVLVDDVEVLLSTLEFDLLYFLLANRDRVVGRAEILDNVWGYNFPIDDSVLDTTISRVRGKLSALGWVGIETIRGFGFRISENL